MAVYVTGMLMPLSMFDVGEWQKLQKCVCMCVFFLWFWIMVYKWPS
jgi:hypothetical protein